MTITESFFNHFLNCQFSVLYLIKRILVFSLTQSRILKTLPNAYQKAFELQPEDGFIKKPKHVADLIIFQLYFI
jgi:hypothetical protein